MTRFETLLLMLLAFSFCGFRIAIYELTREIKTLNSIKKAELDRRNKE